MEIRQLKYFIRVIELGSMGKAAVDMGVVTSTLSQQISRLEGELSARLLKRTSTGVTPTEAGLAFFRHAQLALRHAEEAVRAAQQARLSGQVSIGMAPSTASILAVPFMRALQERYPDIHLRLVESLSGNLASLLNSRQLDMAILFETKPGQRFSTMPLLDEDLFLIGSAELPSMPVAKKVRLAQLGNVPLVMPSGMHGLRAIVMNAFANVRCEPNIVADIDGLAILMDMVSSGFAATIQASAATTGLTPGTVKLIPIIDTRCRRHNILASVPEAELSPAALAAKLVLRQVTHNLVTQSQWLGASLHNS